MVKSKKTISVDTSVSVKGNHLTVTTNDRGEVKLEWDWDSLIKEIVEATGIQTAEVKTTKVTKKKTKK